jgi:hypothetical protein
MQARREKKNWPWRLPVPRACSVMSASVMRSGKTGMGCGMVAGRHVAESAQYAHDAGSWSASTTIFTFASARDRCSSASRRARSGERRTASCAQEGSFRFGFRTAAASIRRTGGFQALHGAPKQKVIAVGVTGGRGTPRGCQACDTGPQDVVVIARPLLGSVDVILRVAAW